MRSNALPAAEPVTKLELLQGDVIVISAKITRKCWDFICESVRTCGFCGEQFIPDRKDAVYCSLSCGGADRQRRYRKRK